jgi:hypothetical protein
MTEGNDGTNGVALPEPMSPLFEERARIERILDRLAVTDDLVERADLASELVRSASRYEDTVERAVFSRRSHSTGVEDPDQLVEARGSLRDVMTIIHERTMHVDPRNVYAPDPQGFEDVLWEICERLPRLLGEEDAQIDLVVRWLATPDERTQLTRDVAHALRHASERPHPPRTALGRMISNANVKLDHTFEDVATPNHPGADTVNG